MFFLNDGPHKENGGAVEVYMLKLLNLLSVVLLL